MNVYPHDNELNAQWDNDRAAAADSQAGRRAGGGGE